MLWNVHNLCKTRYWYKSWPSRADLQSRSAFVLRTSVIHVHRRCHDMGGRLHAA